MSGVVVSGTRDQIAAFRKDEPLFCEFLIETGRIVEEKKVSDNVGNINKK